MGDFMDRLKYFVGMNNEDEEDEYYDIEEPKEIEYYEDDVEPEYDSNDIETTRSKVVGISNRTGNSSSSASANYSAARRSVKVIVYEPKSYEDVTKIIDEVRDGRIIVLNMLGLQTEIKNKIFYCMSGAVYALNGSMHKVAKDIFVIAPPDVDVDSKKITEEMENRGFLRGRA